MLEERLPVKHRLSILVVLSACAVALISGCGTLTSQNQISGNLRPSGATAPTAPQPPPSAAPAKCELPDPNHPSVEIWVTRFSVEKHKSFQAHLDRARFYVVPAQQVFEARGLPKNLVYVALVESGFTPKARSHARAVGMWQFISTTGKRFGLEQNQWIDERCHPLKAARAAADYLSFLYDTFGSWPLALAAYNCGEKAVQDALDRSSLKTFWDLADNGYLPTETREYVPKVFATVKIISSPEQYGFHFDPGHHISRYEAVPVPGGVKLSWAEKQIGLPEASLQNCNPELCRPVTPPGCTNYELCVPIGKGGDLLAALAECPPKMEKYQREEVSGASASVASYKTRPGDTWTSLARKYKCSARSLAALNGSSTSRPIKARQTLKVPAGKTLLAAADVKTTKNKDKAAAATPDKKLLSKSGKKLPQPVHYPIRQGDTLSSIAGRFNVSVKELCARNALRPNQKLMPGDVLVIHTCQQDVKLNLNKSSKAKRGL